MNTIEELVTARAYELPEGGWEVYYSDTPMDMPEYVQEDMFPFFLEAIRGEREGVDEILLYPIIKNPRKTYFLSM